MWRLVIVALIVGLGAEPASSQQWSGHASLGFSGGYQTNLYLDPGLGTWNTDVRSSFLAMTSQVGLTRTTGRTRIDLTVRGQLYPRRTDIPQHTQSSIRGRYRLHPDWTVGVLGGGTRYRFPAFRSTNATVRDSWWVLPALRWTPTSNTMLSLRTGLTQRLEQLPTLTDRQTSGVVSLRAAHWLTERLQAGARLYHSTGRTSVQETSFGGTGGSLSTTYWPANSLSVRGEAALEWLRYQEGQPPSAARDRIARVGLETEWTLRPSVTVFGRARTLRANLQNAPSRTDAHLSAGLRLQVQGVLAGSSDPPPQRRVCREIDEGIQFRVSYDGSGTVHLTGDFNEWTLPGVPMDTTDDETWETTLDLPPGRYAYRFRVVTDSTSRWLDLPSYAQTAQDAFGGTNGVCTVQ